MGEEENELIRAAKELLGDQSPAVEECQAIPQDLQDAALENPPACQPSHSSEIVGSQDGLVSIYQPTAVPAPNNVSAFQKFGDLPSDLRVGEGINLIEVKKLNLAVAVEALERASTAHENFPSPDAGFAVASLSDQILKLTKDLEKSNDPQKILDDLMDNALSKFTQEVVQDLAGEMKKLLGETMQMVRVDKQGAFDEAFKTAVNRMGPAMKERLDQMVARVSRVLNIKETKEERESSRPQAIRGLKR
jgi:hypothetical protein